MSVDSESESVPPSLQLSPTGSDKATSPSALTGVGSPRTGLLRLRLFEPVDLLPLACFRIFFGAMMLYHVGAKLHDRWVEYFYIRPDFHLTYWGFSWVRPWPGQGMYVHFGVMGLAAIGILTGSFYRVSAAVFALCFTYVFLLEKALYQNHYYLICLLSSIMMFVPAHRMWSVDAYWKPTIRAQTVPRIWLSLLRIQVAIPYLYGGIAKINYDWLHGMPMRLWLERRADFPVIGPWLTNDIAVILFAWGGLIFDLLIVPALLWRRTRLLAYLIAVGFHLANSVLWNIGIFPWFMIGATLLFFPVDSFRKILVRRPVPCQRLSESTARWSWKEQTTVAGVGLYVAWQLLFPFRHFLYPGNVSWTEEAHHFSWHMLLREKDVGIRLFMHHKQSGDRGLLKLSEFLGERQLSRMAKDPDMILDFVHHVRDHYRDHGQGEVEIRVLALASLNGRKPQLLIDPTINYAAVERVWGTQPWIVPLHEPLRQDVWDLPLEQWDEELADVIPNDLKSLGAR
ncbi:MAG: HTTM domain-containing protein [Planctomycetaceae bacterium]